VTEHFWLGMMIALGSGMMNGVFSWPMKYSRLWKWENTWAVFNLASTVVLPVCLVAFFVPHLVQVYRGVPERALVLPLIFGFLWGTTHVTIGLSIWAVGMALSFAVIAGMTSLFGSLIPLLVLHRGDLFRPQGLLLLGSMPVLFLGLWLFGKAGLRREKEQPAPSSPTAEPKISFAKGLALCIYTGAFAGSINLGFAFGGDVTRRSLELGANRVTATYAVWALVLLAGFIPNAAYCSYLLFRSRGWGLFTQAGAAKDWVLAITMAALWGLGVFGYGIGATVAGKYGTSAGFALWVAMTIVASSVIGGLTGEWKGTSPHTRRILAVAMAMVLVSVIILSLGGLF
jgi:L-rhamnose-H+ transport protein